MFRTLLALGLVALLAAGSAATSGNYTRPGGVWSRLNEYGQYMEIPECQYSLFACYRFEVVGIMSENSTYYSTFPPTIQPNNTFALYTAAVFQHVVDIVENETVVGDLYFKYVILNNDMVNSHTEMTMTLSLGHDNDDTVQVAGVVTADVSAMLSGRVPTSNTTRPSSFNMMLSVVGGTGQYLGAKGSVELKSTPGINDGWEFRMFVPRTFPVDVFDGPPFVM